MPHAFPIPLAWCSAAGQTGPGGVLYVLGFRDGRYYLRCLLRAHNPPPHTGFSDSWHHFPTENELGFPELTPDIPVPVPHTPAPRTSPQRAPLLWDDAGGEPIIAITRHGDELWANLFRPGAPDERWPDDPRHWVPLALSGGGPWSHEGHGQQDHVRADMYNGILYTIAYARLPDSDQGYQFIRRHTLGSQERTTTAFLTAPFPTLKPLRWHDPQADPSWPDPDPALWRLAAPSDDAPAAIRKLCTHGRHLIMVVRHMPNLVCYLSPDDGASWIPESSISLASPG